MPGDDDEHHAQTASPETVALDTSAPEPWLTVLKNVCKVVIPSDIGSAVFSLTQVITLVYVGHYLSEVEAAQYSAGLTFFNMLGFAFIAGFGAAIDTISSQAFGNNPQTKMVGEMLQIVLTFNFSLGLLLCVLFIFSRPLAVLMFGDVVGPGVATFLRYAPPYLFIQIFNGCMMKTMYAQRRPNLVLCANLASVVTSPLANRALTGRGVHGASLALAVTNAASSAVYLLCCFFHTGVIVRNADFPTPRLRDATLWRAFFRTGFPALVATCAEWWAFEFQYVLAASISPLAVAVFGVTMSIFNLLFSAAVGISVAASVLVGNSLGCGAAVRARQYAYCVTCGCLALSCLIALCCYLLGHDIARFFSNKPDVVAGVKLNMTVVCLTHITDAMQFALQGVFRGAGRPAQAGYAVLGTLWGVGVPASAAMVLWLRIGVRGCLGGLLAGELVLVPLLFFWMTRFDWDALAHQALRTAGHGAGPESATAAAAADAPTASGTDDSTTSKDKMEPAECVAVISIHGPLPSEDPRLYSQQR